MNGILVTGIAALLLLIGSFESSATTKPGTTPIPIPIGELYNMSHFKPDHNNTDVIPETRKAGANSTAHAKTAPGKSEIPIGVPMNISDYKPDHNNTDVIPETRLKKP